MGYSDYLVAGPSLLSGLARTFDIGATLRHHSYNISRSPEEADGRAVANDWLVVGDDLWVAFRRHVTEQNEAVGSELR